MADNTTLNSGTGGDVIASDDIGGVKFQRVKICHGADGSSTDVSSASPLPISDASGSITVDNGGTFAVQASLSAAIPAGTNNIGDVDVLTLPNVTLAAGTNTNEVVGDAAHDAAAAGNPVLLGAYASAAAPSDVSADADVVRLWALRNGAQAVAVTAAGALIGGDATNGLDVDVTRVIPGTSATHLGKAVDSVAGATDTAIPALFIRDDALTTLTPADGDYVPGRVDSTGSLHVRVSAGGIAGIADDAAFTPGTSEVLPVGFTADESSTDSVNEGDIGAARMTLDRKVIITNYAHAAAGGATPYQNLDCDESEDDIKTSAGKLFWIHVMNLHASSVRYIKFYNATAANTTVGSTTPVLTFAVPANISGFAINFGSQGVQFDTAICVAATTGFAVADTGAPGANEIILNAGYL